MFLRSVYSEMSRPTFWKQHGGPAPPRRVVVVKLLISFWRLNGNRSTTIWTKEIGLTLHLCERFVLFWSHITFSERVHLWSESGRRASHHGLATKNIMLSRNVVYIDGYKTSELFLTIFPFHVNRDCFLLRNSYYHYPPPGAKPAKESMRVRECQNITWTRMRLAYTMPTTGSSHQGRSLCHNMLPWINVAATVLKFTKLGDKNAILT